MKVLNEQIEELEYSLFQKAGAKALCTYSIALEAWKRGLDVSYFKDNDIKLEIKQEEVVHTFNRSRGDFVTRKATEICFNKALTSNVLLKNQIPCPTSKRIRNATEYTVDQLINDAKIIGYPVVLKPTYGSLGKGVFVDIQDDERLIEVFYYLKSELGYKDLVIESYFEGEDYRIYVIGNDVVGAIHRIPANIVGDGEKSISELIKEKNILRKVNPYLQNGLIKIDKEVKEMVINAGYNFDSILEKDRQLFLRKICNASAGGDTIDVTDELSDNIKKLAINAVKAIPDLHHAGVDIMIKNFGQINEKGTVIEINSRAEIGIHITPMYGKPRNIAEKLIDYYFPNSIGNSTQLLTFFSHNEIIQALRKSYIKKIDVVNRFDYGFIRRIVVLNKEQITQKDINFIKKYAKKNLIFMESIH